MGENRVEAIRRRMADVRSELHENVDEVVQSARQLTDWRQYIRRHPWLCMGAAAAVGYLIVPKRRPLRRRDLRHLLEEIEQTHGEREREKVVEAVEKAPWYAGLAGAAMGALATAAARTAATFVAQRLNHALGFDAEQERPPHQPPWYPQQHANDQAFD